MPATLDTGVLESVINSNFKSLAERVAVNAVSHDHRLQLLSEASLGQILNRMNSLDPLEASAASRVHRTPSGDAGTDAATIVALAQQLMKGAQTTPPVSHPPVAT